MGGAERVSGRKGERLKSVPLGTERDSFAPNLGDQRHIMCRYTPTHEDSHSLYCGAQKDNGSFNTEHVSCQVCNLMKNI